VYTDVGMIFNVFIYLLRSAYAHQGCIFDQFSILMHFKCNLFQWCQSTLNFQHHYFSLQCYTALQNSVCLYCHFKSM